jgi:hypothetical protein
LVPGVAGKTSKSTPSVGKQSCTFISCTVVEVFCDRIIILVILEEHLLRKYSRDLRAFTPVYCIVVEVFYDGIIISLNIGGTIFRVNIHRTCVPSHQLILPTHSVQCGAKECALGRNSTQV